jgi:hypothetical protein
MMLTDTVLCEFKCAFVCFICWQVSDIRLSECTQVADDNILRHLLTICGAV